MERLTIKVLQRRMVVFSVLALLLTGVVVAASAIIPLGRLLNDGARDRLVHVHTLTKLSVNQHMLTLEGLALQVTSRSAIRNALANYLAGDLSAEDLRAFSEPKLADAMNLSPLMTGIFRRAADGTVIAAIGQQPSPVLSLPAPGPAPRLAGPVMVNGAPQMVVVASILSHDGKPLGSDAVVFSAQGLAPLLNQRGTHQTYLGREVSGRPQWFTSDATGRMVHATAPFPLIVAPEQRVETYDGDRGASWVTVSSPIADTAWALVTAAPASDVFAEVRGVLALTATATAVAVGLGALALLLILRPLGGTLLVQADDMADQLEHLREMRGDLEAERRRLADSNADLEQFAYAASHDLQQPLRQISGFLDLLRRRYDARLDDEGREFIHHAVTGARHLSVMIQGLLEYSRVGRLEHSLRSCDLAEAVRKATDLLAMRVEETGATIDIGALPVITAEPQQMTRLFQNLIDNALKYRHPDRPPHVTITSTGTKSAWTIEVRDNGIGMAPEQAAQAFALFRRLHPNLGVEGTGLGLALCQRIVTRHGGEITLESVEDEGSTFTIRLPRSDDVRQATG